MLRWTFVASGFRVMTAAHGVEGLEQVAIEEPHVIVLDLQMPVMDGRTFFQQLRARGVEAPVVILSAFGAEAAQLELGAQASLNKPFDPDTLVDLVRMIARG